MPVTNIIARQDVETDVFTVTGTDRTASAAFRRATLLSEGSPFAAAFGALNSSLATYAERTAPNFGRLLPAALAEENAKLVTSIVTPTYQEARDKVISVVRDRAAREARFAEPPKELPFADMDRIAFSSLDLGGQAQWIEDADRPMLAALVGAGKARFPGLPGELWDRAVERHAALTIVDRLGTQAEHQLRPTPDQPTLAGPNIASAEAAALAVIEGWRDEQQQIDDATNALRSVIVAVAVATDKTVDEAFTLLNGEAA
jgi:hypothetical protein